MFSVRTSLCRHVVFPHLAVGSTNQRRLEDDVGSEGEEGPVSEVDEPLDPFIVRRRPVVRQDATENKPRDEVERHQAAVDDVDER